MDQMIELLGEILEELKDINLKLDNLEKIAFMIQTDTSSIDINTSGL
jgi:hypothetical protein